MPCDSISLQSVNLAKATPDILLDALTALGWNITRSTVTQIAAHLAGDTLVWTAGQGLAVNSVDAQARVKSLTRMYSVKAVTWAAKRAGWSIQQAQDNKLIASRR